MHGGAKNCTLVFFCIMCTLLTAWWSHVPTRNYFHVTQFYANKNYRNNRAEIGESKNS